MTNISTLSIPELTFLLGAIGVIFTVYHYFKNPQIRLEKSESLITVAIKQLQLDLTNLRDNHVHTLDLRLDDQGKSIRDLSIQIVRLQTIIEERMPQRKE